MYLNSMISRRRGSGAQISAVHNPLNEHAHICRHSARFRRRAVRSPFLTEQRVVPSSERGPAAPTTTALPFHFEAYLPTTDSRVGRMLARYDDAAGRYGRVERKPQPNQAPITPAINDDAREDLWSR